MQGFPEEVRDIPGPCDVGGGPDLRDFLLQHIYLIDGTTGAQRGEATYLKSHSKLLIPAESDLTQSLRVS